MRASTFGLLAFFAVVSAVPQGRTEGPQSEILNLMGTVVPIREWAVNATVPGRVQEVLVEAGAAVKAGDLLARLDATVYRLDCVRCQALVERARATVAKADVELRSSEDDLRQAEAVVREAVAQRDVQARRTERMRELVRKADVDQSLADEADSQLHVADARVQQHQAAAQAVKRRPLKEHLAIAKAELVAAEADMAIAKFRSDATELRAPATGIVLARRAEVGENVGPDGRTVNLFVIADFSQLMASILLPEAQLRRVRQGQVCEVNSETLPSGILYRGQVALISPVVSEQTRTAAVLVRLEVPKGDERLRPGMSLVVRIRAKD